MGGPASTGGGCGSGPALTLGPGGEPVTDNFYFVRQPLAGNGSITVRVTSLTSLLPPAGQVFGATPSRPGLVPWSKAGIIIRSSLTPGSAYAAMMVTGGNGVRMQWNYTGDAPGLPGAVSAASPRWLRLTRDGDTITGYDSADGASWTRVGVVRLAGLPATVQAGLFTASPILPPKAVNIAGVAQGGGGSTASSAVFDHLSRSGAWPASTWTGGYTEGDQAAEAQGIGGFRQASGRITVTGQGDIAPALPQGEPGLSEVTVGGLPDRHVRGADRGGGGRDDVHDRRVPAGPDPDHAGREPASGPGAGGQGARGRSGRVCGRPARRHRRHGVGTAIAHSRGSQIFPEPWPTEARMIIGTGALVAVVAAATLAVAVIVRRSVAAVTIVFAAIVVPYFLAAILILPVGVADWLLRVTPAAAFAVQQATPRYPQVQAYYAPVSGFYPLAPWAGFAVLCAWAVAALGGAVYLLRRRDA